jgi:hypothetical protein
MRTGGPHSGKAAAPDAFLLPRANPNGHCLMITGVNFYWETAGGASTIGLNCV